jgi:hypothetical protein
MFFSSLYNMLPVFYLLDQHLFPVVLWVTDGMAHPPAGTLPARHPRRRRVLCTAVGGGLLVASCNRDASLAPPGYNHGTLAVICFFHLNHLNMNVWLFRSNWLRERSHLVHHYSSSCPRCSDSTGKSGTGTRHGSSVVPEQLGGRALLWLAYGAGLRRNKLIGGHGAPAGL